MWMVIALIAVGACIAIGLWARKKITEQTLTLARRDSEFEELQRSHQALYSDAERRQLALFDNMIEGILLLSPERRILAINPALRRIFSVEHEIVGKSLLEVLRLPELMELLDRVEREGTVLDFELTVPGAPTLFLEVNAVAIAAENGNQRSEILVFHDLTRLKSYENVRKEFVANVSHELRTPLSMIKGYVETLLEGAKDDSQIIEKFLRKIEKHTNRLAFLIEDLLTLSQLESGRINMNFQPTRLNSIVERVREDLSAKALGRSVKIENLVPVELSVSGDGDRLLQVFANLMDNAIKYGKEGGTISVGSNPGADGRVEVFVSNEGQGIPTEAQSRLFERFYRVDSARSREQGGTGLGLAIVKHIVLAHGGEVSVQSQPNGQTTFSFSLSTT